jgi:hypothetical protein
LTETAQERDTRNEESGHPRQTFARNEQEGQTSAIPEVAKRQASSNINTLNPSPHYLNELTAKKTETKIKNPPRVFEWQTAETVELLTAERHQETAEASQVAILVEASLARSSTVVTEATEATEVTDIGADSGSTYVAGSVDTSSRRPGDLPAGGIGTTKG